MTDIKYNNTEYLVDRFLDDIIRLSLVYVKNMDDAQDIASQVFLVYLEKQPVFESDAHAKNWLLKVAVNLSRNLLRSNKPTVDFDSLENVLSTEDAEYSNIERDRRIFDMVMSLNRSCREVIHMHYYLGYEVKEIAKLLGITETSVRVRLSRAKKTLEKKLKGGGINYEEL